RSGAKAFSSLKNSGVRILTGFSVGISRSAASAPTALGSVPSPRPRGWSGRVITPTTRKLALGAVTSRSSIWAAKAGVPMKTIFNKSAILDPHRGGAPAFGLALLDYLFQFALVEFALDSADAVDE